MDAHPPAFACVLAIFAQRRASSLAFVTRGFFSWSGSPAGNFLDLNGLNRANLSDILALEKVEQGGAM